MDKDEAEEMHNQLKTFFWEGIGKPVDRRTKGIEK